MFLSYRAEEDFVGMDMARKFLQMGYRGHEGTPIISQAVRTPRALESYCLTKRTTRKHNRLRCFIRNGRRSERIRSIYN